MEYVSLVDPVVPRNFSPADGIFRPVGLIFLFFFHLLYTVPLPARAQILDPEVRICGGRCGASEVLFLHCRGNVAVGLGGDLVLVSITSAATESEDSADSLLPVRSFRWVPDNLTSCAGARGWLAAWCECVVNGAPKGSPRIRRNFGFIWRTMFQKMSKTIL